jgi:hypothetical protein
MNSVLRHLVSGLALAMSCTASFGADMVFSPESMTSGRSWRDQWEFRTGAFAHGVGSVEKGPVDFNAEIVLPRWNFLNVNSSWDFLVPRLHFGGMLSSKTSYGYLGGLWNYEITHNLFIEGFVGGAYHNGSLNGDPIGGVAQRSALGCRLLFHSGGNLGYHLNEHWSVMATFDHLSNGNAVLGACPRNQGLNEYGLRIGYGW